MTQIANPNPDSRFYQPPPASVTLSKGIPETILTTLLATDVKGNGYALPENPNSLVRSIMWRTTQTGAPTSPTVTIEVAMNDVDAEYVVLDTSTTTTVETRIVNNVMARWIRGRSNGRTGGTQTDVKITI